MRSHFGQACCRIRGIRRRGNNIHTNADHRDKIVGAECFSLQRNADKLSVRTKHIIRPFEPKIAFGPAHAPQRLDDRYAGRKAKRRGDLRLYRERFRDTCGKISARRDPDAATPAAPRRLLRGGAPDRARWIGAQALQRFRIG